MARIGIDCRLWGVKHTGIGRYTQKLVENLQEIGDNNEYIIFCRSEDEDDIKTSVGWKKVSADIPHYTLGEQTSLVQIFLKENLDLLHVPHFNVPIFYPKKFVITIHDILWHTKKGFDVTTLPPLTYLAKYAGYRLVVRNAASRAKAIFVPSKSVAEEVTYRFPETKNKVHTTYEGVDPLPNGGKAQSGDYLLYVGSLYPHKNLQVVLIALKDTNLKLKVVSARNVFHDKAKKLATSLGVENKVEFLGQVTDKELGSLYAGAQAFVFPTLSEGFGLPGLEAMQAGCPVVCSDIPVLHEIYGNAALYFDPNKASSLTTTLNKLFKSSTLEGELEKYGKAQLKKYSWEKMAKETLKVYREVLGK